MAAFVVAASVGTGQDMNIRNVVMSGRHAIHGLIRGLIRVMQMIMERNQRQQQQTDDQTPADRPPGKGHAVEQRVHYRVPINPCLCNQGRKVT